MSLTPQDIQSQQFNVRFRGFDIEEVDAFLEKVAEECLLHITENQQLREKVDTLTKEVESWKNQEQTFHNAIISTQRIADELMVKTRKEADEITESSREEAKKLLADAQTKAGEVEREAETQLTQLRDENRRLEEMKNTIQEEIRAMLHAYLNRLDEEVATNLKTDAFITPTPSPVESEMVEPEPEAAEESLIEETEESAEPIEAADEQTLPDDEPEETEEEEFVPPFSLDDTPDVTAEEALPPEAPDAPTAKASPEPSADESPVEESIENESPELSFEETDEDNLDELYEKIDLLTDTSSDLPEQEETVDQVDLESIEDELPLPDGLDFSLDSDDLTEEDSLPDLEGDMLISLQDPLDELESSVTIADDDKED